MHPATTRSEIQAAMRMARMSAGPSRGRLPAALSVGIGLLALMVGLSFFYLRDGGGVEIGPVFPMAVLALIILLGLVVVLIRSSR